MRQFLILLAVLAVCLSPASAGVLTFDDIPNASEVAMPAGYGGFTWSSSWWIESWAEYTNTYGNTYPFPTPENTAFNGYGDLNVSMSGAPFTFNGAYFTGWAANNSYAWHTATAVTVTGYLSGNPLWSTSVALPANAFVWLAGGAAAVDTLVFTSSASGNWWLMDNFTFNESAVPEPGTLGLCIGGLVLAVLRLRRR